MPLVTFTSLGDDRPLVEMTVSRWPDRGQLDPRGATKAINFLVGSVLVMAAGGAVKRALGVRPILKTSTAR